MIHEDRYEVEHIAIAELPNDIVDIGLCGNAT